MANYLPLLLVSVSHNAVPDDTSLSTQARGQVDYLSHEWREEDVWRSWRNMTRQKNEIANGARLENASWRTWWKQRNKLKTISPETLNWSVLFSPSLSLPTVFFRRLPLCCTPSFWDAAHQIALRRLDSDAVSRGRVEFRPVTSVMSSTVHVVLSPRSSSNVEMHAPLSPEQG